MATLLRRLFPLVLTGGLVAGAAGLADDAGRRAAMIERLGDRSFTVRTVAEAELLRAAMADPELAALVSETAASHPLPEVRARARQVQERLAEWRRFGESRITIQAADVTALEAAHLLVEAIHDTVGDSGTTQGLQIGLWPEDEPFRNNDDARERRVTLDVVDQPFWTAIEMVCEQTQLWPLEHQEGLRFGWSGSATPRFPRGDTAAHDVTGHAARVELTSINRHLSRSAELRAGDDGGVVAENINGGSNLSAQLRLLIEPKLRVANQAAQVRITRAVDEAGNSLIARNRGGRTGVQFGQSGWTARVGLPLDAQAARESGRIAELSGTVSLEAAVEMRTLRLDLADAIASVVAAADEQIANADPAVEAGDTALAASEVDFQVEEAGWTLRVERIAVPAIPAAMRRAMRRGDGSGSVPQVQLWLSIEGRNLAGIEQDWARRRAMIEGVEFRTADGAAWDLQGRSEDVDTQASRLDLELTFSDWSQKRGVPTEVVWSVATRTRTLSIPFMFRDIPLPSLD